METNSTNNKSHWSKGVSGNPAGRPPGSRNRSTAVMEALFEGESEKLIRKAIGLALEGDTTALRLCLDRLVPVRKDRSINLDLPPVSNAQQVAEAMTRIVAAIGDGLITPHEGASMANILSVQNSVVSMSELERRVELLEQRSLPEGTRETDEEPI
jgi:hypothetical protein